MSRVSVLFVHSPEVCAHTDPIAKPYCWFHAIAEPARPLDFLSDLFLGHSINNLRPYGSGRDGMPIPQLQPRLNRPRDDEPTHVDILPAHVHSPVRVQIAAPDEDANPRLQRVEWLIN